ncbi:hypothetical protein ACFVH7_12440 [Kitasatospora indigofera]|uniref:hypothetical protein n=1 Tax=Kitasatospora indigofera TaxID=67307 RepID=UPI003642F6AC
MSEPVRITPGSFGYAEVHGADEPALALLAPLGFAPPRRAPRPVSLHTVDGPLTRLALIGEAARRLEKAGYTVEVDPQLRLSPAAEQALEILGELSERLGELGDLLADMDNVHDLARVAAQMVTGPGNLADAASAAFTAGAQAVRHISGFPFEREGIADWFQAGAEAAGWMAALASTTSYPPPADPFATRADAARACSPAARTATSVPISATAATTHPAPDPRRARA